MTMADVHMLGVPELLTRQLICVLEILNVAEFLQALAELCMGYFTLVDQYIC